MKYKFVKNNIIRIGALCLSTMLLIGCGDNAAGNNKASSDNQAETTEETDSDGAVENVTDTVQSETIDNKEDVGSSIYRPLIIGHRGYPLVAPENSMSSFQAAKDFGADMIELDVQLTNDGYIVVYHDINTEPVTGENAFIADYSYSELRSYSIGAVYENKNGRLPNCNFSGYYSEKIPTLNEVMRFARDNDIRVDIEIKSISDMSSNYTEEEITWFLTEIVDIVEENDMMDKTIFSSFNYLYLQEIEGMNPEYVTFFITNMLTMDAFETKCNTDGIAILADVLEEDSIERIHNMGKEVYVWTVDSLAVLKKVSAMGADGIITNNVGLGEYF